MAVVLKDIDAPAADGSTAIAEEEPPLDANADPSERFLALKARRRAEAARIEKRRGSVAGDEDYRLFRGDTASSEAFRPFNYGLRRR